MTALLDMNTHPSESEPAERSPGKLRFTYGSGSQPLDGYTIKRGVGRGGFGEVYYAVSDAGKDVALKLIRRNLEVELRGVTHCLNLKHPNLIDIYDIRTDENDDRWVVMEYVSGASLDDLIARHPDGMPVDMAVQWFRGICEGVAHLHDHGVVHRDLKPANIFIDDGRVKIGDYGLSKFISCSRRSGQTESVGTVHYMAPEIANGRYGREIDTYAVGIILFEMLTGHVPFEGESVGEVLMKHLTAEPDLTRLADPFRGIVASAMAKDPEHRTQNVTDMLQRATAANGSSAFSPNYGAQAAAAGAAAVGGGPAAAAAAEFGANAAHTTYQPNGSSRPVGSGPAGNAGAAPSPDPYRPGSHGYSGPRHGDIPPEPIAKFVKETIHALRDWLGVKHWPWPGRVAVAVLGVILLINVIDSPDGNEFLAFCFFAGAGYVGYRVTRSFVIREGMRRYGPATPTAANSAPAGPFPAPGDRATKATDQRPAPHTARVAASGPADAQRSGPGIRRPWRRRQQSWQTAVQSHLRGMSWRDRTSQLLGSMVVAAIVGALATLFAGTFAAPQPHSELYLWMTIVTIAGSWAVLIPAKLCEGHVEDQAPLRFAQLLGGAIVGFIAFGVASELSLNLPTSTDIAPPPHDSLSGEFFDAAWDDGLSQQVRDNQSVSLAPQMHVAYFAFLLLLMRWWRMAESSRPARVSFWSIAWAAFVGWVLTFFWWYPQPVGMLIALCIAFTVQISSPWMSSTRRTEIAEEAVA